MNKLLTACVALAALAVIAVLPATAMAENDATLVNGVGNPLGAGITIIGNGDHNAKTRWTTASGEVFTSCTTNRLTGVIQKNTHAEILVDITSSTFEGETNATPHTTECTGSIGPILVTASPANGLPYCLYSRATEATDTFKIRGGSCSIATRPITVQFHITTFLGSVFCAYTRSGALAGTVITSSNFPLLLLTRQQFIREVSSSSLCPAELFFDLEAKLQGDPAGTIGLINAT